MIRIGYILILLAIGPVLALGLASCAGGAAEFPAGSFVGRVDGSELFVAITTDEEGNVLAYACDNQADSWFRGTVAGDTIDLTSQDGARLQATLGEETASGTFTPAGGQPLTFNATPATGNAGLYRAEGQADGDDHVAGWIVLANGEQRGVIQNLRTGAEQPLPALVSGGTGVVTEGFHVYTPTLAFP
ncbi:MAG: hypothetical protein L0322_19195 [Chloroflexi bacterium]|nr:hypothetical protein [Chloroflexota bacterium]MCI0645550.1 hypothetical protein [Chloroflexota bacterium]